MNINQFLDKIHFKKICAVIIMGAIYIALQGCFPITATLTLKDDDAIYHGPKKAAMTFEEKGRKVTYTGMGESVWDQILKFMMIAPRAYNSGGSGSETNINLSP